MGTFAKKDVKRPLRRKPDSWIALSWEGFSISGRQHTMKRHWMDGAYYALGSFNETTAAGSVFYFQDLKEHMVKPAQAAPLLRFLISACAVEYVATSNDAQA